MAPGNAANIKRKNCGRRGLAMRMMERRENK
jgi:hypothetical protein